MSYKPTKTLPTSNIWLTGSNFVLDMVDQTQNYNINKENWYCGYCSKPFFTSSNKAIPLACTKCGKPINWEGKFTDKIHFCSLCNVAYSKDDDYCPIHIGVNLEEREYWKPSTTD